ncbi:MAG: ATP-binding protein [Chloroflexota bacterium]
MQSIVASIDNSLPQFPAVRQGGSLLMMAGLPGSGKSSLVRQMCAVVDCIVISTDHVRAQLVKQPSYTLSEMALVYEICYELIAKRLKRGQRVIFDASNYLSARRERLFSVAQPYATPIAVCYVQAAQEVIQLRLQQRTRNGRKNGNMSDADWSVYMWMLNKQEPLKREHIVLDTTATPSELLAQNLHQYWLQIETNAPSNGCLQSLRRTS